ncbi:unnamed protein product, partial [Amoebophrya sp. A25]
VLTRWKALQYPIELHSSEVDRNTIVAVWTKQFQVTDSDTARKPYLKMAVHSDFLTADFRFSLSLDGQQLVEPVLVSSGYSNLVELAKAGQYSLKLYYLTGDNHVRTTWTLESRDVVLCPKFQVDLRMVHRIFPERNDKGASSTTGTGTSAGTSGGSSAGAGITPEQVKLKYGDIHGIENTYASAAEDHSFDNVKDPMSNNFDLGAEDALAASTNSNGQVVDAVGGLNKVDPHATWLCKVGLPSFPTKITSHAGEPLIMDSIFVIPFTGSFVTTLYLPEEFLLKIQVRDSGDSGHGVTFSVTPRAKTTGKTAAGGDSTTPAPPGGGGVYQISDPGEGSFLAVLNPKDPNNADLQPRDQGEDPTNGMLSLLGFELTIKEQKRGVGKKQRGKCPQMRINL